MSFESIDHVSCIDFSTENRKNHWDMVNVQQGVGEWEFLLALMCS